MTHCEISSSGVVLWMFCRNASIIFINSIIFYSIVPGVADACRFSLLVSDALLEKTDTLYWHCLFLRVCVCVCVCMAMSSPVLLTWVIFIVPISTLPARWVGLEDLSKPTSERQHVHRRGLFTQTCRRPLSGSDISPIFFFTRPGRNCVCPSQRGGSAAFPIAKDAVLTLDGCEMRKDVDARRFRLCSVDILFIGRASPSEQQEHLHPVCNVPDAG